MPNIIIKSHLKTNWKLILFFSICALVISIGFLVLSPNNTSGFFIIGTVSKTEAWKIIDGSITWTTRGGLDSGMQSSLKFSIFGIVGIIFTSIISFTFVFLIFNKEIKTGQITIWMTSKLSRNKIILWKIFYIWSALSIIYFTEFIPFLIVCGLSIDFLDYVLYLFIDFLWMYLFILMITSIFIIINVSLSEKSILATCLTGLIIAYIITTWICNYSYEQNPDFYKWAKNIKYFSLDSLFVNFFNFEFPKPPEEIKEIGIYYNYGKMIKPNITMSIICFVLTISLTGLLTYLTTLSFNFKDLRI